MLRLDGRWVWDFWFAEDGGLTHVFYLQAPRSLGDPERRHRNARLGRRVSSDLVSWEVLPDPLPIGPAGAWDDLATWTGSIIRGPDRTSSSSTPVSNERRRARPADRPRHVGRSPALGALRRGAPDRGGPALVRAAGPRLMARPGLARSMGHGGPRRKRLPRADHGEGTIRRPGGKGRDRARGLAGPAVLGGPAAVQFAGGIRAAGGSAGRRGRRSSDPWPSVPGPRTWLCIPAGTPARAAQPGDLPLPSAKPARAIRHPGDDGA